MMSIHMSWSITLRAGGPTGRRSGDPAHGQCRGRISQEVDPEKLGGQGGGGATPRLPDCEMPRRPAKTELSKTVKISTMLELSM